MVGLPNSEESMSRPELAFAGEISLVMESVGRTDISSVPLLGVVADATSVTAMRMSVAYIAAAITDTH